MSTIALAIAASRLRAHNYVLRQSVIAEATMSAEREPQHKQQPDESLPIADIDTGELTAEAAEKVKGGDGLTGSEMKNLRKTSHRASGADDLS